MWYKCGPSRHTIWGHTCHTGNCTGEVSNTCYARSANGKDWEKPLFNQGTNTVRGSALYDGNTVWLDRHETNPARRFKIAEVRSEQGSVNMHCLSLCLFLCLCVTFILLMRII